MELLQNIVITDIPALFAVNSPKGRTEEIKNRGSYGLSFCREGQITYTHRGKTYRSDPHCAVILPRGQTYTLYGDQSGLFPVINFTCADVLCDTIMVLPIENAEPYMKDFEQMQKLLLFEGNRLRLMSVFYGMIHRLCTESTQKSGILAPALKYLENNYTNPALSNLVLAQQCNISEVYLRKLFAARFGATPRQHLIDIRMGKARQLLTDGVLSVTAVSEACGFSNVYHFCRLFKQKTGLTPMQYMKENKHYKI